MEILIPIVIVIGLIVGLVNVLQRSSLSKFQQLGDIRGKTLSQVIDAAGLPNSYSNPAPGRLLVVWCSGAKGALALREKLGVAGRRQSPYAASALLHI
jgi:hypothetical protein